VLSTGTIVRIYAQGADAILRLITKLEDRIEDLEAQLTRSPQPVIASLMKELAQAKSTLERQRDELIEAHQQNHQLVRRIRELEREIEIGASVEKDSHNSSLPPSSDPPWKKVKRTRSLKKKSGKKVGGQPGHKGYTLLQVAHPDEIIVYSPTECRNCHASFEVVAYTATTRRRQVFDISDGRVKVTEHRAGSFRCSSCQTTTKAKFPRGVRAPVQYGSTVIARAVYLRFYQFIPAARTSETMRDFFGCKLSPATVERAGHLCSDKLVRTEQQIKAAIRDSPVVGADETGLRVGGGSGWVHVARTETLTHYGYDKRRGKPAMDEIGILPQFKGVLIRDGWASYKWYEQCRHALCNSHLLRELAYIEEVDPEQKVWTEPFTELLFAAKDAASASKAAGEDQITSSTKSSILNSYEEIVKQADALNPPLPAKSLGPGPPVRKRETGPTPRSIINRCRRSETIYFAS
jgi:transposase